MAEHSHVRALAYVVGRALSLTGGLPTALDYLAGRLAHEQAVARVRASRVRFHRRRSEPLIVEANAQWSPLLPVLRDAFPKAKFVVITRDRETWVASWLKRGTRHTDRDPVHPSKRLTPVTLRDQSLAADWPGMKPEDKLRWEWEFITRRLRDFAAADALTKLYNYEDIFLSDGSTMRDMLEFVSEHDGRRYPFDLDPALLTQRINAA